MVYRFILVSLADMCPKRPLNQIKVIFGDGIFDSTLSAGIDLRAKILGDVFHLFMSKNSNWKKGFGTDFGKIEPYLNKMIHSFSEQYYADAFNSAKELLLGKVDSLEYLSKIDKDKEMFARYLVKNTRGNMDRQGSTPAEQNHASYVSRIGPRSVENITFGISAMFERQRQLEQTNPLPITLFSVLENVQSWSKIFLTSTRWRTTMRIKHSLMLYVSFLRGVMKSLRLTSISRIYTSAPR